MVMFHEHPKITKNSSCLRKHIKKKSIFPFYGEYLLRHEEDTDALSYRYEWLTE